MKKSSLKNNLVHPGVILKEIIEELGISQERLTQDTGISSVRISNIINGSGSVTGDIALRVGEYFGQSPQFWMNLQKSYDIKI